MTSQQPDAVRLATLVHVARHGSLTGAAKVMGVTTSAVSQQMSALEADCGVRLIDRQSRGVTLTGAGTVLLERAEEVVRQLDETSATMAQLNGGLAGPVRVAAIASGAASIVLPAVQVLSRTAPAVTMSVTTLEPSASIEAVVDGTVDVALIDVYDHVPFALPTHLLVEEVLTEPLVVVSARDAELPRRPSLTDLKDSAWVIPPAAAACGAATRHACRSAGFEPRIRWVTDDLLLLVAAVSRGEGVSLLPRRAVADSIAPVSMRQLTSPALSRRMMLITRQATGLRPIVRACLDALHHAGRVAPGAGRAAV